MEDLVLSCLESRVEENRNLYARFLVGPFLKGEALTVATALRRILLSSVESIGITALYIQGITHEFSTIVGVRESVLELSLNFGGIVLSYDKTFFQKKKFFDKLQIGYLQVQGPKVIYANHLKLPLGVKLVDPTQYIATVSKEGSIILKFIVGKRNNFLHKNIGPELHFGNPVKEMLIAEEIGKKNITRAKKKCFYKNGFTINSFFKKKSYKFLRKQSFVNKKANFVSFLSKLNHIPQKQKNFLIKHSLVNFVINTNLTFVTYKFPCKAKLCTCYTFGAFADFYKAKVNESSAVQSSVLKSRAKGRNSVRALKTPTEFLKLKLGSFAATKINGMECVSFGGRVTCLFRQSLIAFAMRKQRFVQNKSLICAYFRRQQRRLKQKHLKPHKKKVIATSNQSKFLQLFDKNKSFLTCSYVLLCLRTNGYNCKISHKNRTEFYNSLTSTLTTAYKNAFSLLRNQNVILYLSCFKKVNQGWRTPFNFATQKQERRMYVNNVKCKTKFFKSCKCNDLPFLKGQLEKKVKIKKSKIKQKKLEFLSNSSVFQSNICLRNVIPLDLTLTPVLKVNFVVEIDDEVLYLRQKIRERIIFEVWTNGSIHPRQAIHDSSLRLLDIFANFRSVYQLVSS